MYKEYFKLIFRHVSRSRLYTVIHVGGLAIAFAVALSVYSYVVKEWQTDRFHTDGTNIYRATFLTPGEEVWYSAFCSPMGENAKKEIPGVKEFVRIVAPRTFLVKREDKGEFLPEDRCIFTDSQFFSVLSFPLVAGQAGPEPGWAVISETTARKYFGEEPAVGKVLILSEPKRREEQRYRITGIVKDFPVRSSLQADILLDFKRTEEMYLYGGGNALTTLLQLEPRADAVEVAEAIAPMEGRYSDYEKQLNKKVVLQPLREVYLHSDHIRDYENVFRYGSLRFNYVLCGVAFLILLLASCNYLMIQLAQLHKNVAMYAILRCFGAGDSSMRKQVCLETGVHIGMALLLSVWLVSVTYPYFVGIVAPGEVYETGLTMTEYLVFGGFIGLFLGVTGQILSFWVLERLDRNGIGESIRRKVRRWDLKQVLLVGQMGIFCGLFFASLLLSRQMSFVRDKPMGYDNRNIICIEWPGSGSTMWSAKQELMRHPGIKAVTNGRPLPYSGNIGYEVYAVNHPEKKVKARALLGDEDYLTTYSIRVIEGHSYRRNEGSEDFYNGGGRPGEAVINQKMAKELGLESPLGEVLSYGGSTVTVVGIVEDFHYKSLYEMVEPVIVGAHLPGYDHNLSIRYREGMRQEVLTYLHRYYRDNYTNFLLQYSEYSYIGLYARDVALVKMIHMLTMLAILISAMGILAFSMFVAESRTKEMAIRKVNGATVWQVVELLNRSFAGKMLGACLVGLPVAYVLMDSWMQGFAYRTSITWWLFVLDAGLSLLLVLSVATWQIRKTALRNPVEVLKSR